uniref:ABC transporter domain-containing protein n=4 Tax=Auxenochlorella protothecoides TaxID=3075 RepID=A0A1D2A9Y0_AUXPR
MAEVEEGKGLPVALHGASPTHQPASPPSDGSERKGGSMRGLPVVMTNITCSVKNSQNRKEIITILNDVSGFMRPGEMVALMGPSGSGKTTLMDILSGRKNVGKISGEVLMGGNKPSVPFLRRYTGYVEQFDTLVDYMTVEEMLIYTAEMKRPVEEEASLKVAAVEDTITALGLASCRKVKIGNHMARGISGGQAKRVNIGLALVTNPRILFLDEPTSGLDSYTSNEVMTTVKTLARRGLTVCATIHSPTPYCFHLFDRLLLLLRGQVVYFGTGGQEAVEYFVQNTPVIKGLMEGENEAEWIVDLTVQADRQGKAGEFAGAFAASRHKTVSDEALQSLLRDTPSMLDEDSKKELAVQRETTTPFWWALLVMIKRRAFKQYKNPEFVMPRIAGSVLFSLVIFTLYWKKGDDLSTGNLYNIQAVLFMWVVLPAYNSASTMPTLVMERQLFTRERNDGLYRVVTFLFYKMVEEVVILGLVSLLTSLLVFYTVRLMGLWVVFWLANFVTMITGTMVGYWFAALSPNMDAANALLPLYITIQLLFAGFLLPTGAMPNYWRWAANIDFLRYGWGALMKNQFYGDRNVEYVGGTILGFYDLAGINMWGWLGIELCFFVVFAAFTWTTLQYLRHDKR